MSGLIKKSTIITIAILSLALSLLTVFWPKKNYSENENRYLEEFPKLSFDSIKDASFMKDSESYVSDHFILRDFFMTVKTVYERMTGRNQVNKIYMCRDGYYIEEYNGLRNTAKIEGAIKRLSEKSTGANIRVMLVPTAVTICDDKLPATAKNADQLADIKRIENDLSGIRAEFVDVSDALRNARSEQIFYKLDHHWTTLGAYTAYRVLAKSFGFEPIERNQFEEKIVSTDFKGSFYSKVNDLLAKPDSIVEFKSQRLSLNVKYPDRKLETDKLTADEYLEKKDKYSYFLNNQNSFVEVHNENAQSPRTLAVVKDSYANCMISFLAEHFSTIYVFDTRFYRNKVTDFINENNVSDVLFLYNMHTIDTDTGINTIN
ncbi:MAG: DHHW family protein [Treponema sp.]|nr:DHHW family protein [Treponema sp.]